MREISHTGIQSLENKNRKNDKNEGPCCHENHQSETSHPQPYM